MKLGANNSKKTWIAVALAVVAIILTVRMFIGTIWSPETTSASSTTPATSNAAPRATTAAARPVATRRLHLTNARKPTGNTTNANLDPRLRLDLLKETETATYTGEGRNIFKAQAEDVKIPVPVASAINRQQELAAATPPPPPQPPPPPPINLKFFGFASQEGAKSVFLSAGEDVFIAKEGDIVQRRYKIVKINPTSIEVMDVLNNNQQTIPLTAG